MSRSLEQGKDLGEKPFLNGILKREEKKKWIFHVAGQGQQEEEPKGGRGTLQWEDKAMTEGLEGLLGAGMQYSKGPSAVSWFYLLTK